VVRNLAGEMVQRLFELEDEARDIVMKQFTMEHIPTCHVTPYDITTREKEQLAVIDMQYFDVHYEVMCEVCYKRRLLIMIREDPLWSINDAASFNFRWRQSILDL
jgi:hypothetical protein